MSDYRDNMTLDEIAANDLEMTKDAIKNSKRYKFFDPKQAFAFTGQCMKNTLDHIGVKIVTGMHGKMAQRIMDRNKVQIESRKKYQGDDQWRNGIYIYKAGELVAFISNVFKYERPSVQIAGDPDHYFVITNARVL